MRARKRTGQLRPVFLSRISPMKNLLFALKVLQGVSGDVCFDIYGPVEDLAYWKQSEEIIETLPPTVKVRYMGMVNHEEVWDVFAQHDLLFLPTFGENFCHVIREALSAGCPVLISDQTPWRSFAGMWCGLGPTARSARPISPNRAVVRGCRRGVLCCTQGTGGGIRANC